MPSEAEWEYAAHAGTTTVYSTGDEISHEQANFSYKHGKTLAVAKYPANAFGLFDMHGNVWEWVADHWHDNYSGAPDDGSAWVSNGDTARRVVRGGSWHYYPGFLRSAARSWLSTDERDINFGLRLARTL